MVVHSEEGLDEISCEKNTYVAELDDGIRLQNTQLIQKILILQISPLRIFKSKYCRRKL